MALRDFVTGSDMCTPDEGAGPSNAAAALANSLLGRSAKDQERLREVCKATGGRCAISRQAICSFNTQHAYTSICVWACTTSPLPTLVLQLPGVQGLPGPSVYGGGFAPTVDSVAQAAAEGQSASNLCLELWH